MFQNNKRAAYLDYLMIIVGTALMAVAINSVFDMSGMVTGGFSGIAILVKEWTQGVIQKEKLRFLKGSHQKGKRLSLASGSSSILYAGLPIPK